MFAQSPAVHQKLPIRAFLIALCFTVGLLVLTSWLAWQSYLHYENTLGRHMRLQLLMQQVDDAPSVTALARTMAVTGRLDAIEEYRAYDRSITAAVEELELLAPDETIGFHAERLALSNARMGEIEQRALELTSNGYHEAAEELLFGANYQNNLAAFSRYGNNLRIALREKIDSDITELKRQSLLVFGVSVGMVPFLLVLWVAIIRTAKFHLDERNRMEADLRQMSLHDELTGLYNRRGFTALAEQQWRQARRTGRTMLLVFTDVDELKKINDSYGHQFGDEAIRQVGIILNETFRESDILGRIGGDEFVALITDFVDSDVRAVQRRIYKGLRSFNKTTSMPFQLSLSIGFAWYDPREPKSMPELIAEADATMYQQKKSRPKARVFRVG